jgi:multisubunit Na+/H+ antiporter MnhF subunit
MTTPSTPKKITWIIGMLCGILGIIGHYADVQILSEYNYVLLLIGFIALAAGTTFREL